MTDQVATAKNSGSKTGRLSNILCFPYEKITGDQTLEHRAARFVWIAVPLEYYVLTRFGGGLGAADFLAVALIALMSLVAVLLMSLIISLVPLPRGSSYEDRVRALSLSLILNWTTSLFLLAAGYAINGWLLYDDDVVAYLIFRRLHHDDYPHILDPITFLVYVCYAFAALILVEIVARRFGREPDKAAPRGPNVFIVVFLTAMIMMVVHGATKLT